MDIKSKVQEILEKEDYTFSQLAEYLQMTEQQLSQALGNKTLELRNLEAISKALRVPLYSFFRNEDFRIDLSHKPFYVNRMWTGEDETKTRSQLEKEIDLLKQIIKMKEEQLMKMN
jgi:transcriptional regulator with XRE-family HTH domain